MKELMLDKRDAALALLKEIAALPRYSYGIGLQVFFPNHLIHRIDLVLDLPDEPRKEAGEDT